MSMAPACLFAAPPPATSAPDKPDALAVQGAMDDLKSPDWIVQSAAMATLASAGVAEAVEPLGAIFKAGPTPYLRGRALVALAAIRKDRMLDDAVAQSRSQIPAMRSAAAEALGIIGGRKAESAIRELLADKEPAVRNWALVAFARVAGPAADGPIAAAATSPDRDTVRYAIRAMAAAAAPSPANSRRLTELAAHVDPAIRAETADAMGQGSRSSLGDPVWVSMLMAQSINDPDPAVRAVCERNLARFDARQAVGPALAALRGDKADLYPAAVRLLASKPSADGVNELARLFAVPATRYDKVVADVLGLLADTDAERYEPILVAYLTSPLPAARLKAIESLAHKTKANLFDLFRPLVAAKGEADPIVLAAALAALETAPAGPREGVVNYLAPLLARADTRDTLFGATRVLRAHVTTAQVGDAIAALAPLYQGKDDAVRHAAAEALDRVADDDARRRIAQAQGYVTDWKIIGPFQAAKEGLAGEHPPDREIDFARTYDPKGEPTTAPDGPVTGPAAGPRLAWADSKAADVAGRIGPDAYFSPADGDRVGVMYGVTALRSERGQKLDAVATTRTPAVLYVNGEKAGDLKAGENKIALAPAKGLNAVRIKLLDDRGAWGFSLRLIDPKSAGLAAESPGK